MNFKKYKVEDWWIGLMFGSVGCFFLSFTFIFDFQSFLIALPFCITFIIFGKYGGQLMLEDKVYIKK